MKFSPEPASKNMFNDKPLHNVDHVSKNFGGDGHSHDHEMYGKHAAGFQKEHERVQAMCGGGMTKRK
jgi:hypothetical protein